MDYKKIIPAKWRTIAQQSSIVIAGLSILFTMSCKTEDSADPILADKTPDGVIHIERVKEAEAVFDDMGLKSWIFKHKGGELTTEFKVSHRPAGKDQKTQIIFHGRGDASNMRPPVDDWEPTKKGGHIIVVIPRKHKSKNYVKHHFSIDGMYKHQEIRADKLFSDTIRSATAYNSGGFEFSKPITLHPGETRQIANFEQWFSINGVPEDEREHIQYSLHVSAPDKD